LWVNLDLAEFHQTRKSSIAVVVIQFVRAAIDEKFDLLSADKSGIADQA
jgi:hypothetical protein